eukprot:149958-Alexandrium_andersonii.AAC.1
MSASLVGSEMCIRDRRESSSSASLVSAFEPAAGAASSPAAEGRTAAVSYTHLTLPTICSV